MSRYSPPVKSPDGAVIVRPLRAPAYPELATSPRYRWLPRDEASSDNDRVDRGKILRDVLLLVSLPLTILAGSVVLIGTIWRDVALARNETRLAEIEQATKLRLAEIEALANQQAAAAGGDVLALVLAGLGALIVALVLLRPIIVTGR